MPPAIMKHADLSKTVTYLVIHLSIGFSVAYLFTGSIAVAGGIALVEPMVNAVAFFFHEKVWRSALSQVRTGPLFPGARVAESDPLGSKSSRKLRDSDCRELCI